MTALLTRRIRSIASSCSTWSPVAPQDLLGPFLRVRPLPVEERKLPEPPRSLRLTGARATTPSGSNGTTSSTPIPGVKCWGAGEVVIG